MRGAIREDDDIDPDDESPKEDPYGDFHRVFSHFYDPVHNRGLTVEGHTLGANAADWALNPAAITPAFPPISLPGVAPTPQRFNHFGLATFHESLWRALTGLNEAGVQVAATASERNLYWTAAFRTLGGMLHLIQDMAQPQHTRNDPHAGGLATLLTGHKSVFERYVDARIRNQLGFSTRDDVDNPNVSINLQPINFGTYPIPRFARYSDYWATAEHKGIANYSNRGFFSLGTLPGSNAPYATPSPEVASYTQQSGPLTRWDGSPPPIQWPVTLYVGNVPDAQLPAQSASGVPLFAWSVWDEAAQGLGRLPQLRLAKHNYDAAIDLLIPRAVAYSAGILQYAFRGRLEINPPAEGVYALADHSVAATNIKDTGGFRTIKLIVKNTTPGPLDTNGQPTLESIQGSGALYAVVKFRRNTCYEPMKLLGQPAAPAYSAACKSAEDEIAVSGPAIALPAEINSANGQALAFGFQNPVPINATDVYLRVVYRGQLGEEADAVVVATKDISEPSFYNFDNYSDCERSEDGVYSTVGGRLLSASMSFNGGISYPAQVTELAPGRYARFALLADNYFLPVFVQGVEGTSWATVVNQQEGVANDIANPTPVKKGRRTAVPAASDDDYLYAYSGFGFYPWVEGDGYLGAQGCLTPVAAAPGPLTITFEDH